MSGKALKLAAYLGPASYSQGAARLLSVSIAITQHPFALYVDDIGSSTPGVHDHFPFFGLGGVLVERSSEMEIKLALRDFKTRWNIPPETPC